MKDFLWGTSTASYQIEGGVAEDGRTPSIWDTFSHTPGKVVGGDTGDVACDHYHRAPDDIRQMAKMGVGAYRFSLSWPRILAGGRGVDFYQRLVDDLRANDIEPFVTLNHWDLPQQFEDAGGWPHRDTAYRFAEYAALAYAALGDRVTHWTTHNEPWCVAFLGYGNGVHAPGRTSGSDALAAAHHLNLAHGLALPLLGNAKKGIALNLHAFLGDPEAVRRLDAVGNRIWLDPIFRGSYPADLIEDTKSVTDWAFVRDGDLAAIHQPLDYLGLNYYTRNLLSLGATKVYPSEWPGSEHVRFEARELPQTDMGWWVDPAGLTALLERVHAEYGPVPLYITENGAAYPDSIDDQDRIAYLESHIRVCQDAVAAGIPLRGYFLWSLMDNFEWSWGYSRRFGIIQVDYESQARTPRASAHWYADLIRKGHLGG